jgi:predicted acyltransferase
MAGLDFVVFAIFAWLADGLGWTRPLRPLVIFGSNAIVIYFASETLAILLDSMSWHERIYNSVFAPLASPANASLLFSLAYRLSLKAPGFRHGDIRRFAPQGRGLFARIILLDAA